MDVFISYSHDDRAFAGELEQRFESDGISTWIDYKNATWGKPFPASIEEGLDQTRHIICLMSPSWISSAWSAIERYSAMVDDPDGFWASCYRFFFRTKPKYPDSSNHLST